MTRPPKHAESMKAKKNHILPITDMRQKTIGAFLDSQKIPETQLNILKGASAGIWQRAARQTTPVGSYTTGLSPDTPVPHYHMGTVAMYLLKHGVDKVSEMNSKIKESRSKQIAKAAYDPLNIFRDRRQG